MAPFWDQFGAATVRRSQNFRFRKQIPAVAAPNRFRNQSRCIFPIGTCIGRFPKLSLNQHPAGSHSKVVLCCSQAQKNMRGAIKIIGFDLKSTKMVSILPTTATGKRKAKMPHRREAKTTRGGESDQFQMRSLNYAAFYRKA